jgi:hypothetical protein
MSGESNIVGFPPLDGGFEPVIHDPFEGPICLGFIDPILKTFEPYQDTWFDVGDLIKIAEFMKTL